MSVSMEQLPLTPEQQAAIFDANIISVAEQYLADFDYPTDEGKAAAIKKLAAAIERAANAWIERNCAF